jgi:ribosomal-protein-alanine N-acetyltransferase
MSDEEKMFTIGRCRKEELREIRRILEGAPEAALWSEEALAAALGHGSEVFLVARGAHGIEGFILGRIAGDEAEILNLAVKEEFRRRGAGSSLVKAILAGCESSGCTRVFLEVRESNQGGVAFYQGLGFRQIGRREGYYRDPAEAALILARPAD